MAEPPKIRMLICDDKAIICEGLRASPATVLGIVVAGTAHNGLEAPDLIPFAQPNLVLMDLKMPQMNGIQATRPIPGTASSRAGDYRYGQRGKTNAEIAYAYALFLSEGTVKNYVSTILSKLSVTDRT